MAKPSNKAKREARSPKRRPISVIATLASCVLVVLIGLAYQRLSNASNGANVVNVSVRDLAAADEPGHVVLDVREPWEYAQGHVPGVTLIPLGELKDKADTLPDDVPIYVICRSGNRSLSASRILAESGKRDVRNVQGGILAWQQAGLPVER